MSSGYTRIIAQLALLITWGLSFGYVAVTNVSWAWGLPEDDGRYMWLVLSIVFDVGAFGFFISMKQFHRGGNHGVAALMAALWAVCAGGEILGSTAGMHSSIRAIEARNNAPIQAAKQEAEKARLGAEEAFKSLESERKSLGETKDLIAKGGREGRLEQLRKDRDTYQANVTRLSKEHSELSAKASAQGREGPSGGGVSLWKGNEHWAVMLLFGVAQAAMAGVLSLGKDGMPQSSQTSSQGRMGRDEATSRDGMGWDGKLSHPNLPNGKQGSTDFGKIGITVSSHPIPSQGGLSHPIPSQTVTLGSPASSHPKALPKPTAETGPLPGNVIKMPVQVVPEPEKLSEEEAVKMALRMRKTTPPTPWPKIAEATGWPQSSIHRKATAIASKKGNS